MSVVLRILFATWMALMSFPLWATQDFVSLYQAALQHDANYLAVEQETNADRLEVKKAKALFYPKVQLGLSRGRGETDRTTSTVNGNIETQLRYDTQNYALSVKQPIFSKEINATFKSAESYVSSKESLLKNAHIHLMAKVAEAYLKILYAVDKIRVLNNSIAAIQQQLNQANLRYQNGEGTVLEVSESQTNLDVAHADLIQTQGDLDDMREVLFNLTGRHVDDQPKLVADAIPKQRLLNSTLESWLDIAQHQNPEIMASKFDVETARYEVEKKQAGHYPTLDLVGLRSYSQNDSNNTLGSSFDSTTLALQLNVPIFAGGYVSANVDQSLSRLKSAENKLDAKSREVLANVRKHFNGIKSQLQLIHAYEQAVKSAELTLDGTQKAFRAGVKTNIEVLNTQQKLFSTQLDLNRAYYTLITDVVGLYYQSGKLDEDELIRIGQYFVSK